jgi:uncharacterized protein (TIGR02266 family)
MGSRGEEQRVHPRLPLILQVQYPDREGYTTDATENLSVGGLFVRTTRSLAIGDRVPMRLSFPGLLEPMDLLGVVAWIRPASGETPGGVGVRIPDERPEDRARLLALLEAVKTPAEPAARDYRILLVEDNPLIMELYEFVMKKLAQTGKVTISVVLANDGADALKRLADGRFDLVVTDLYMPLLDGFELIRRIRSGPHASTLPVVAVSAGDLDDAARAHDAGASVYLRKPVKFTDVLATVKLLLKI